MQYRGQGNQYDADDSGHTDGPGSVEIDGRPHEEHAQRGGDLSPQHRIDRNGKGITDLYHDEIKKACQKLPQHGATFGPHQSYRRKGHDILMTFRRITGCVMGLDNMLS